MEAGSHGGIIEKEYIKICSDSYEKAKDFKYLSSLVKNQSFIHEEIKLRLKSGYSCYYSGQTLLSSRILSINLKLKTYKTIVVNSIMYLGGTQAKGI
jgi:hypothetical protein